MRVELRRQLAGSPGDKSVDQVSKQKAGTNDKQSHSDHNKYLRQIHLTVAVLSHVEVDFTFAAYFSEQSFLEDGVAVIAVAVHAADGCHRKQQQHSHLQHLFYYYYRQRYEQIIHHNRPCELGCSWKWGWSGSEFAYESINNTAMKLSRQLNQASTGRDFANLEKYQNRQPSIFNLYFGINLITAVDKLPNLERPALEISEANLQQNRTQSKGLMENMESEIEHKVMAYHHEIDRLNQDTEINQYIISNVLLGRGAHSTVKMAKSQDKFFAIKILWFEKIKKKFFIKQKQLIRMVNAEINLLLRLRHPNIILFREAIFSPEKERMFIVLEYCSSGSLLNVAANKLTIQDEEWRQEVRGYFIQMVEAISFIHESNVIHRDIKPENMLLNDKGVVKVIDFNISEVLPPQGTIRINNKFIGTKGYAAPQLIIGTQKEKLVDGRSLDIWSLGITLLELLEKRHPFSIKTLEQLHQYLSQQIPINQDYPSQLKDLLKKMLRKNNQERIKIRQIAKHPWLRRGRK